LQSWGQNTVSAIVNEGSGLGDMLQYTFDAGTFNEGTLSVGDSGGPLFIQDPHDNNWKLAGINYGVEAYFSLNADGSNPFFAAIFDRSGLFEQNSLGVWLPAQSGPTFAEDTRIASNLAWINSITQSTTWTGQGTSSNWSNSNDWASAPSDGNSLIFDGTARTSNSNNTLTSVGSLTFRDTAGAFTLSGNALTVTGGITNYSTNTQTINLNLTLGAAQQFNAANGNIAVGGTIATGGNTLTVAGAANTTLSGAISGLGALAKNDSGTLMLSGNNSYSGGTTVGGGTLVVAHVHGLGTGALTINNSATTRLQAGLTAPVQLPGLTIAGGTSPTATLDVTNNNMVVHNGDINTTIAQLKSGLNSSGTLWTGSGIQSSTAAADAAANANSTLFAVGAIKNIDKFGNAIYSTWPAPPSPDGGATGLTTADVLVKYTYFGDADLNGVVDNTTDYDLWSNGFMNPSLAATNGWLYGDFDYSGTVDNTTDYDLWSTGFVHQGSPLVAGSVSLSVATSIQSVPEPSALLLAALGLTAYRARGLHRKLRPN
jgi:autotransporter-associated beta strand protein